MRKSSLFLLVTILLLAVSAVGYAADSDYTYKVSSEEDKTCRITNYTGKDETLVIPEQLDGYQVTGIDAYAFWYNDDLREVVIPDSITSIGHQSFACCPNLRSVTMPSQVLPGGLASSAFKQCSALESIVLPEGLIEVQENTFLDCTSLKSVVLPKSLECIGENAFKGCKELGPSLDLPHAVWKGAFAGCKQLTEVTIHEVEGSNYIADIYTSAFEGCTSLSKITFGDGEFYIEENGLAGLKSLNTVVFGKGTYYWPSDFTFAGCTNLTTVVLPDGLTEIKAGMFDGCTSLKNINIPDSVTTIGENALRGTAIEKLTLKSEFADLLYDGTFGNSLKELTITGELETFDIGMISGQLNLQKLVIPDSVIGIVQSSEMDMPLALESMNLPQNLEFVDCFWLTEQSGKTVVDVYYDSVGYHFALDNSLDYRLRGVVFTSVSARPLNIFQGQIAKLLIETEPAVDLTKLIEPQFDFTSSNPDVVSIDEKGYVTGHALGKATITIQNKADPFMYARAEVEVVDGNIKKCLGYIQLSHDTSSDTDSTLYVVYGVEDLYPPYDITMKVTGHTNKTEQYKGTEQTSHMLWLPLKTTSDDYTFNYEFELTVTDANGSTDVAKASFTTTRKFFAGGTSYKVDPVTGRVTLVTTPDRYEWRDTEIVNDYGAKDQITELSFTTDLLALKVGESKAAPYTATTAKGNQSDAVYFLSSDPSVVRIGPDGELIGVAPGTAEVKVMSADGSELSSTLKVICADAFVEEITLEAGEVDRETLQQKLTATVLPAEVANTSLKWTSSDESIATVDDQGVVTWLGVGTVTFTAAATDGTGVEASIDYQWDGILVEKLILFLRPNGQQVGWRVEPANATNPMVTFRVDKPAQVEIDAAGYLRFFADCEVTVRATTTDGSEVYADLKVTGSAEHEHLPFPGRISMRPATETEAGSIPRLMCVICKEVIYPSQTISPDYLLQLPADLKMIGEEAFCGSTAFQQVNLPDGLTTIASRAFADCRNPLVVCVPDTVNDIAADAFDGVAYAILVCSEGSYAESYAQKHDLMTALP